MIDPLMLADAKRFFSVWSTLTTYLDVSGVALHNIFLEMEREGLVRRRSGCHRRGKLDEVVWEKTDKLDD